MESSLRIVAITNCPAGIAHTYIPVALKTAYPAKRLPLPITSFSLPGVA